MKIFKKYLYLVLIPVFVFVVSFGAHHVLAQFVHGGGGSFSATTGSAGSISYTSAVISGNSISVPSGSSISSQGVEYGTSSGSYPYNVTTTGLSISGAVSTSYSETLTGLSCGTTYYFVAYSGGTTGSQNSFSTTSCGTWYASTGSAGSVTANSAVISGNSITIPYGSSISSQGVKYGTTSGSYPYSQSSFSGASGPTSTYYSESLSGLSCGTTYYYVAYSGSTVGSQSSFTTTTCNPSVSTVAASSVAVTSANLNGSIFSGSKTITYVSFTYGSGLSTSTSVSFAPGTTNSFSIPVTGLSCNTSYTFSAFAQDSTGASWASGTGQSFTTGTCPTPPTVTTTSAGSVTGSSAVLAGSITSSGTYSSTEVGFIYGLDTTYGATSTTVGTYTTGSFSKNVASLQCSSTYHYRAYAKNSTVPGYDYGYGSDKTFNTGPCTGSGGNVSGYLWSSTIGWISLNCNQGSATGGNDCGVSSYSVNVTPNSTTQTGLFSGYAWSPNIGWVSFNPLDVSSCGAGAASSTSPGAQAKIDFSTGTSTSGQLSGWARALSGDSTTWDGCISLRGSGYGATSTASSTSYTLGGYGWGSATIGWVSFANASIDFDAPSVALTVSSSALPSTGGSVSLSWTTANLAATPCTASSTINDWTGSQASGGGSRALVFDANTGSTTITRTYQLSCKSILGATVVSSPVSVAISPGASSSLIFLANNAGSTSPLVIAPADSVDLKWELQNVSHGTCVGTSSTGSGSFAGWNSTSKAPLSTDSDATSTVAYDEIVYPTASSTSFTMTCHGTDGSTLAKSVTVQVSSAPSSTVPSITLTANGTPENLALPSTGGAVTLAWTTANLDAAACTASSSSGDWTGSVDSSGGTYSLGSFAANGSTTSPVVHTYTISGCTSGGAVVAPVTVTVTIGISGDPYLAFTASNGTITSNEIIATATSSITLGWTTQNMASCKGSSAPSYSNWASTGTAKSYSAVATPATYTENVGTSTASRTYTMTCVGSNGSTIFDSVTIHVNPSPLLTFTVNDGVDTTDALTTITLPASGGTANLVWDTTNLAGSACTASSSAGDWTGSKSSAGGSNALSIPSNASTTNAVTRTYTLSGCVDSTGASVPAEMVTVIVAPSSAAYLSFFVGTSGTYASIPSGGTANLGWTLANISTNSCHGFSSGSYSGWNNTVKGPSSSVGATSTTFHEIAGLDGSITAGRTYTMTCGSLPSQTVTLNITAPCVGVSCLIPSTSVNATHRPPWMEI